jgi:DNA polymerase III gamma/tau subunit
VTIFKIPFNQVPAQCDTLKGTQDLEAFFNCASHGIFVRENEKRRQKLMRLGRLARKLELRPIDIVDFLANKNITIDEGTNTKIEDAHAALIFQHFAPTMSLTDATIPDAQPSFEPTPLTSREESVVPESEAPAAPTSSETTAQSEVTELIKAPKIELSGLKIIGKIDLPEPKKKLPEETPASNTEQSKERSRENRKLNGNRPQRSHQNPIALQREHEAFEVKKQKEEELRRQKEKRTQNYLKKVKAPQPTKAAKFIKEQTEQMSAAELAEPPKTWWGKFIKWLTT